MTNWLDEELHNNLSSNGVFIVGHARSGTTVLGHALNTSGQVAILFEADFHLNEGVDDFPSLFNAKHAAFRNPPSKGARCPPFKAGMWESLLALRKTYKLVGDKIAFSGKAFGQDPDSYLAFLYRRFPSSYFICTLRNPDDSIASSFKIAPGADQDVLEIGYLQSLRTVLDFYFTFDRVILVQAETVSKKTFKTISAFLQVPLPEAHSEYLESYEKRLPRTLRRTELMERARFFHGRISGLFSDTTLRCTKRAELRRLQFDIDELIASVSIDGQPLASDAALAEQQGGLRAASTG